MVENSSPLIAKTIMQELAPYLIRNNRVGDNWLFQLSTSHTTVRTVPYTAVRQLNHFELTGASWTYS